MFAKFCLRLWLLINRIAHGRPLDSYDWTEGVGEVHDSFERQQCLKASEGHPEALQWLSLLAVSTVS